MNRQERTALINTSGYEVITACRACHGSDLEVVVSLGPQVLVDFVDSPDDATLKVPLELNKCRKCGLVQLCHSVNPELMYRDFWYRSGINESMRNELYSIVDEATARVCGFNLGDNVLDIGSNDGTLLAHYHQSAITVGVDPANVAKQSEGLIDLLFQDFFDNKAVAYFADQHMYFKVITAIAMFYDIENPADFLRCCRQILLPEGLLIIQMNYLVEMLKKTAFDNIVHEHLTYFSLTSLRNLAEDCGFIIEDVSFNNVNGGSFRVYLRRDDHLCNVSPKVWETLKIEEAFFSDKVFEIFTYGIRGVREKINDTLERLTREGNAIFAYGASTRGSTLLQTLGCSKFLMGAAERDERKYGKMTAGSWLRIFPEDVCRNAADCFLVLPWHFKDAILAREQNWLKSGGKMIFPLSDPSISEFNCGYAL